jgi:hypothetical protein
LTIRSTHRLGVSGRLSRRRPAWIGFVGAFGLYLSSSPSRADWEDPPAPPPASVPVTLFPGYHASWVSVAGGLRVVPQLNLAPALGNYGLELKHHDLAQPAASAALSWKFADDWTAGTEFGFSPDRYALVDGSAIVVQTFMLQAVIQWSPRFGWSRVEPYLAAGIGYYFSGVSRPGAFGQEGTAEADAAGGFAAVGVRIALTTKFGLTVEERYAFAYAPLGPLGSASAGGNTVAAGLYWIWKD